MRVKKRKLKIPKTIGLQIIFVIIAFAIMAILSYLFMSTLVENNIIENSNNILDITEERITSRLSEYDAALESYADGVTEVILNGASAARIQSYTSAIATFATRGDVENSGIANFYGYFETLPTGAAYVGSHTQSDSSYLAETSIDDIANGTDWYIPAVEAKGEIISTVPRISESGYTMLTFAKAIYDEDGRRLAVVCMDAVLDRIGKILLYTAEQQGGYGMLLNQNLLMMFHPNPEFVGMYLTDARIPVHIFADELGRGQDIFEEPVIAFRSDPSIAFFRQLDNGWYLGVVTPEAQYYSSIQNMGLIVTSLAVIMAVILIIILMRLDKARISSEDKNQKKTMFLANMSHEIRTPINAIVGMTAIGKTAPSTDRKDYCFSKIDIASKHLLGVINDILDMSKIEASRIELSSVDFAFERMLMQAVNTISPLVDDKNQKLMVHIDNEIPKILLGDDQRIAQVTTNLLSNAMKFTPNGGSITLRTALVGHHNDEYTIKISVTDTGIGVSPEQQKRMFRSYEQAEVSTTRKYGGTGLGLAISKSIVEMMGGEIWVESELGKGATIAFTIKLKHGDNSRFDLSRHGVNWHNVRILAVDDDPDILTYFEEVSTGFGVNCEVAPGAKEALGLIEQQGAFNIYFIDLRMPDVDGIELTKEIRARETDPGNSIVIMITSADLSEIEHDAKKAGVDRFLLKPLFPSAISDIISECIGMVNDHAEVAPETIEGIFKDKRILLVEDIEINREIVAALLEPTLVNVDFADNGIVAVEMFKTSPGIYDLILMDIQMPEMDGYEATRKIRALNQKDAKTIPIVAMTANVFKEDIERCIEAGMNSHLGKPIDITELLVTMRKYFGQ